jgi:hypothetical protein
LLCLSTRARGSSSTRGEGDPRDPIKCGAAQTQKNSPGRYARGLNSIHMVNREKKAGLHTRQERAAMRKK